MRISIEAFGDEQLDREMLRFINNAEDLRPALEEIEQEFYDIERRQFSSQGAFASGGWAPLKPSTLEQKARTGARLGILQHSGALIDALTGRSRSNIFRQLARDRFVLIVRLLYPRFHQSGTRRMPRRRPVELRRADRSLFVKILQRHIVGGARTGSPLSRLLA